MSYTDFSKNKMLAAQRLDLTAVSLHTADPGTNGANEVSGGSYARVTVTAASFTAPSGGVFTLTADMDFVGPAGGACGFFGLWDGTDFVGGGAVTGDTTFNAEGDFVLKAATSIDLNLVC